MRVILGMLILSVTGWSCAKQRLPAGSRYNVVCSLNDSLWYGKVTANRVYQAGTDPSLVKEFNLQMMTDLGFPGNESGTKSPFVSGCLDPECVPTQRLHIYNIPLRKGKYNLAKLDRQQKTKLDRTHFSYLMNGGGLLKRYTYEGRKPGWLRISGVDKKTGHIEGSFSFHLDEDLTVYNRLKNEIPPVAKFQQGLFRVQIVDVKVRP
jgi:hypothetical protein